MQKAAGQIAVSSLIISVAKKTCWQSAVLVWMIFTSCSIPAEVRNTAKTACKSCSVWHCGAGNSDLTFHFYLPLTTLTVVAFLRERYCTKLRPAGDWEFSLLFAFIFWGGFLFFFFVAAAYLRAFPFSWLFPLYSNRLSSTHSNADWRWRAKNPKAEIPGLDDGTGI